MIMAIDTARPRTRRALLMGTVSGVAAAAVASVARISTATAADGDIVKVGDDLTASSRTRITRSGIGPAFAGRTDDGAGLAGEATGGGMGVRGTSDSGIATFGESDSFRGIVGASRAGTGVYALSTQGGLGLDVAMGRIKVGEVSGVATIPAGSRKVVVQPGFDINPKTFFVLTPQANIRDRSLWYTKNGNQDRFAIRMSRARNKPTKVAWLALERG